MKIKIWIGGSEYMSGKKSVFVKSVKLTEPDQFKGTFGAETYNIEYSIHSKQFTGSAYWTNISLGKDQDSPKSEITILYRQNEETTEIKSTVNANAHFPFLYYKETPFVSNWKATSSDGAEHWTWTSNFHESILLNSEDEEIARINGKPWSGIFRSSYLQVDGEKYKLLNISFIDYLILFFKSGMKSQGIGGVGIEQIPNNLTEGQILSLLVIATTFST